MNKKQEAILKLQIKIRLLESDSVRIREWKKAERIKWNEMMREIMSFCLKRDEIPFGDNVEYPIFDSVEVEG